MNKKIIIAVVLAVLLVLGGTLVFAAVNEDGTWVNPFSKILSNKIEEGTITQQEADIFNKVMEAIKGDMDKFKGMAKRPGGAFVKGEWPQINEEAAGQIKALMETKKDEIIAGLVEDGIIDSAAFSENGLKGALNDTDEETIAAIKEAFSELDGYYKSVIDNMVTAGTLTQEEADFFLKIKDKGANFARYKMNPKNFTRRMPKNCPYLEKTEDGPQT